MAEWLKASENDARPVMRARSELRRGRSHLAPTRNGVPDLPVSVALWQAPHMRSQMALVSGGDRF